MLLVFGKNELFMAVNTHYHPITDILMANLTRMGQPEVIITTLVGLFAFPALRNYRYFVAATACNVLPLVLQQSLKHLFHMPRPLAYYHDAAWIHHLPDWPRLLRDSFPSGHSQGAFSFFCFLSLLLPARYQRWAIAFFVLAMLVGYSRLYLAAHFFEDVYAGSIIGTVTTTLLFVILQRTIPILPTATHEQLAKRL
ncbi:MAG: phosphatase PAP2 family protein [Chitinophagia bacterium]|nr:phosphatase PAP2 family protein [Chitinophagia bacterium]